jgi:hypothetical protein
MIYHPSAHVAMLFTIFHRVLFWQKRGGNSPRARNTTFFAIKHRMDDWVAGNFAQLWQAFCKESIEREKRRDKKTLANPESPSSTVQHLRNRRRAVDLAREGSYSKAIQALTSEGVANARDPAVVVALRSKHPFEPEVSLSSFGFVSTTRFSTS